MQSRRLPLFGDLRGLFTSLPVPNYSPVLAIAKSRPGQHKVATIFLEAFPVGTLATADVKRARNRLRKLLERNGFKGSHLIGSIG
jgi:hypothetical protein